MAFLARLSILFFSVRASQPLPERIVNNCIQEDAKVTWGAELAPFLKLGIGVLARSDIVQRSGKELMPFKRSPKFVGEYTGSIRKRKPCVRIEVNIPDLVAEVAIDTFGFDSLD
jgi:hypothetical protein